MSRSFPKSTADRGRQGGPATLPAGASAGLATIARRSIDRVARGRLATLPLALRFWDGSSLQLGPERPEATLLVRGPSVVARLLREPTELGLAEAWMTGELDVEGDLDTVVRLRDRFTGLHFSWLDRARIAAAAIRVAGTSVFRPLSAPATEAHQSGRPHSLDRDRAAIRHHYDVSNRFYELLLGPTMSYSCGAFASPVDSLETAQEHKHELICQKLALKPGERLLDIGCGWGSLLLHAVRHHRVRGIGVTLSERQARLARERVRDDGLSDQIEIRIADYRQLTDAPYDKIASVGMYEHVGAGNYDTYIRKVRSLLRPGGLFFNDGIARLLSGPRIGENFISRYVFPDGELHPLTALLTRIEGAELEIRSVQSLREDYARTLRSWYSNLERHRAQARAEIGEQRVRVWELYMLGSAHSFTRGEITNYHVVAQRPG